jgi:hypothetical protein
MRQITGYMEDLWETKGLDIPVPSFGHLSDLFRNMPIKIKHYCEKAVRKAHTGEKATLIADSTGMRFDKAVCGMKKNMERRVRKGHGENYIYPSMLKIWR